MTTPDKKVEERPLTENKNKAQKTEIKEKKEFGKISTRKEVMDLVTISLKIVKGHMLFIAYMD